MSDRVCSFRLSKHAPIWLMAAITGLTESVITWCLLKDELGVRYAIAVHLSVLTAIAVQALLAMKKGQDLRLSLLLFGFTFSLGPGGAVATGITAALTSMFAKDSKPFEEWYRLLFPDQAPSSVDILDEIGVDRSRQQSAVMPLIDVLAFGTDAQKQALVTLVTANFKPAFAPILKTALNDSNNAIRVQAATGITKIEEEFTERTLDLAGRSEQAPEDAELLKSIAQHYDQYAYAGLLEPDREMECRGYALMYYGQYLVLRPDDAAARVAVGRILVRDRKYEEAVDWFERNGIDEHSSEPTLWYLESLFRTARFEKLRLILAGSEKQFHHRKDLPIEILEATKLWLAGNEGSA